MKAITIMDSVKNKHSLISCICCQLKSKSSSCNYMKNKKKASSARANSNKILSFQKQKIKAISVCISQNSLALTTLLDTVKAICSALSRALHINYLKDASYQLAIINILNIRGENYAYFN